MKSTKCINLKTLKFPCFSSKKTDDTHSEKMSNQKPESTSQSNSVDQKLKNIQLEPNSVQNDLKSPKKPFKVARNKIALKPGRSLMDWIRLGTSGKDLTGVNGQFLDITPEELKKHDKHDDAWLSINGKVYNVSAYSEFHPGGLEEIEKGFGKDATQLFMQAHAWVNYENMLQKCVVGRLVRELASPIVPTKWSKSEKKVSSTSELLKKNPISYDWYQSNEDVVIVLYTKNGKIKEENVILDINEIKELLVTVFIEDSVTYLHFDLEQTIQDETQVNVGNNGKIEIILRKEKFIKWQKIGEPLSLNEISKSLSEKEMRYRSCKLVGRKRVTENTFLLSFAFSNGSQMRIPSAKHISFKLDKNEVERSYTPVPKNLNNDTENAGKCFYLMIKIYSDGLLTPDINDLEIGDFVQISDYFGLFDINAIDDCEELVLFAAGTGVTPMLAIVHRLLVSDEGRKINIRLVFFNRTRDDILWRDELQLLADRDKRFTVEYVLSEPDSDWEGPKGRVSMELVEEFAANSKENVFFCICGPTAFNQSCNGYLQRVGVEAKQVHVFANN